MLTLNLLVTYGNYTRELHDSDQNVFFIPCTGISFYSDRSHFVFGEVNSPFLTKAKRTSELLQLDHVVLSSNELNGMFPYITLGENNECLLQRTGSGLVNPRKLVAAQKQAAQSQGCDIVASVVDHINKSKDERGNTVIDVIMENGQSIRCYRVLLCTGGFTHSKPLLPPRLLPKLNMAPTQTMRVELSAEEAETFRGMPSISSRVGGNNMTDCYFCPPITYPDGKFGL